MGMKTGLGTDGCASNNNLDLFTEMDTAAKLAKVSTGKPDVANTLPGTQNGNHRGCEGPGLEKETGSLEKGKKADIIVVDLNSPSSLPPVQP
jgi:5-methylthioadenosine/S-adenosylhomocysteine deaminase